MGYVGLSRHDLGKLPLSDRYSRKYIVSTSPKLLSVFSSPCESDVQQQHAALRHRHLVLISCARSLQLGVYHLPVIECPKPPLASFCIVATHILCCARASREAPKRQLCQQLHGVVEPRGIFGGTRPDIWGCINCAASTTPGATMFAR